MNFNIIILILGFLLGIYFYKKINIIYHGPNSNIIRKKFIILKINIINLLQLCV